MAQRYLTEYYSYREWLPASRIVEEPETALEIRIQRRILTGNRLFFEGKYGPALYEYLEAWGLLPKLVVPYFPADVALVDAEALLAVDDLTHFLEVSGQILMFRDSVGPNIFIPPAIDPPPEYQEIIKTFTGSFDQVAHQLDTAVAFARCGQLKAAKRAGEVVLEAAEDPTILAHANAVLGAIGSRQGSMDSARRHFETAGQLYGRVDRKDAQAAMEYNLAVSLTLSGETQEAGALFGRAAIHAPSALQRRLAFTPNPGLDSVEMATMDRGLNFMVAESNAEWLEIPSTPVYERTTYSILRAGVGITLDLANNPSQVIEAKLLQPRVQANTLAELQIYMALRPQFVAFLAHVRGFVLPMAIGDAYFALRDYNQAAQYFLKVRDYKFLNQAIERPLVWRKLARCYLNWANRLYRDRDIVGARTNYENIVRVVDGGFDLDGPLYTGGFAELKAPMLAFLNSADRLGHNAIEYARRIIILEALSSLQQILNGINYLGFPEDIIPIHSWRYLQNVARYFAGQAIQSERAYINFKQRSEQEAFTKLTLEQAVDAQQAALQVEELRVEASGEQRYVAQLSANLAQSRLDNAVDQKTDYDNTSAELAKLEEITAWATGPMDEAEVSPSYADALGISPGTYDTYHVTAYAARARSQVSRAYELRNMQRKIDELQDAKAVADAQVAVADKMVAVAEAQRDLAELRRDQAQAQLAFFDAREFTAELWDNLAQAQLEISRHYIDWAIAAAFLMERAFEFEYDLDVNRIRFDYEASELNGLFAGDFLLQDINQFSYDRLLEIEKPIPVKLDISLAERFPFQFYQEFQHTGRMDFELPLDDFDTLHPGGHIRKLRKVEVVVEGVVGPRGLHGTLSNSGVSYFRGRDGLRKMRLQKPETLVLSRFDIRRDGFVFTYDEGLLAVFENSGVASGWVLEFPPTANDVNFRHIINVHLVLYYDEYHSSQVANSVRAELAAEAIYRHGLGLALRYQFPDEFFGFQDSGSVEFVVDSAYVPHQHANPRIEEAYLVTETTDGVSAANLNVRVQSKTSAADVAAVTDAHGMIHTEGGGAFAALKGLALEDEWTVSIPKAANAAAFGAGFSWDKVRNIYLSVEYSYVLPGMAEVSDSFVADPLGDFDVVDDAQAVNAAPSTWVDSAAAGRIEQTSNIHAPAGGANLNTDPDKPGTYLVRKEAGNWEPLRDFVLSCTLNSGDNDGIGVVFRYQDADNFYFYLMDAERQYRRIGRKRAGTFEELSTPALDTAQGYQVNQDYELTIAVVGDAFKAYLDGDLILSGQDDWLMQAGRVGFYAWGNTAARFDNLSLQPV